MPKYPVHADAGKFVDNETLDMDWLAEYYPMK